MADKKYVPQGVYLACDKGTTPTEFKITNNNNVFLFEEPVANTGDMAPNVNILPFGSCSVKSGSPCMPVPTAWQGFEDGIFIGNFNPLLEDSVMQCGVGGKIEIFYSLEEAEAASDDGGMSFWQIVGAAVLVVAAVALIVVTGGAAIAAFAAIGAASGALATGIAVTVFVAEVAGAAMGIYGLIKYANDGDEEALFKDVALGFLFLGAGKVLEKGFRAWKAGKAVDDVVEVTEEIAKPYTKSRPSYGKNQVDEVFENAKQADGNIYDPNTGELIPWDKTKPRNGQWDMGHNRGKEYRKYHKDYMDGKITKEEFLEIHRNPSHYQPELPGPNRSHKYEQK
ncbi:MAG: GH-E family nuclease [Flavobacteriaceae bacterium]|nr:GH-E family nuclease [Flavobacteriaceae bacterium]